MGDRLVSRRVVGWSTSSTITMDLAIAASMGRYGVVDRFTVSLCIMINDRSSRATYGIVIVQGGESE